jgi:hypothetical protein
MSGPAKFRRLAIVVGIRVDVSSVIRRLVELSLPTHTVQADIYSPRMMSGIAWAHVYEMAQSLCDFFLADGIKLGIASLIY